MKKQYTLSVCITTFNMEMYIERAVESVLMQQVNFDYEIIVADDCSTDNTLPILQQYQQRIGERFRIIYAEKNRGLIENFVGALKASSGKFIASLDADDYWVDKFKLQQQVGVLSENDALGYSHTNYYNMHEVTGEKRLANSMNYRPPRKDEFVKRLLSFDIAISTTCFRKSALDYNELDVFVEKKFPVQDYPLFLNLTLKTKGHYLEMPTTIYSVRPGSMSRGFDVRKRIDVFNGVYEIGNFFIEKYPISAPVVARRAFKHKLHLLLASWESNDFDFVRNYAKSLSATQFLRYNPKAIYVFYASKNKLLYDLFRPWLLRKREVGK